MFIDPFSTGKVEMSITPQTLNISNLRPVQSLSTCIWLESLYRIFFRKRSCKGSVYSYRFRDIAVQRYITRQAQRGAGSKRVQGSLKNQKNIWILLKLLLK